MVKITRIWHIALKKKDKVITILKYTISISTIVYLYLKLKNDSNFSNFYMGLQNFSQNKFILLVVVSFLTIPNWLLEGIKWKLLLKKIEKINIKQSLKAVLGGVSVSMLTPNRLGEIPGRSMFVSSHNRSKALAAATVGSFSQSMATFVPGFISLMVMVYYFQFGLFASKLISSTMAVMVLMIVVLVLVIFQKNKAGALHNTIFQFLSNVKNYSKIEFLKINTLSMARYFIFVAQFYIFLIIFDVETGYLEGFLAISATYLVLYMTPFLTIAEIGVRGSAALLCIGYFSDNAPGIVLAGFSIWLVNIVIPAIFGSMIMIKSRSGLF